MEVCPYSYFWWCGYFRGPWVSFVTTDDFPVRDTKNTARIGASWTHRLHFCFWPMLAKNYYHISKGCKPDNFESLHSFKTWLYKYLRPLLKFFWLWFFPWIKLSWDSCSLWDKSVWLNWFWQFLWERLPFFNPKGFYYSYAWSHSLCQVRTSFCMGLISRKLCGFLLKFLTDFTSFSVLLLFPLSITFFAFMTVFHSISQCRWGSLDQAIC